MFLRISQNLQENNCVRVSLFKKRDSGTGVCFPQNFVKFLRILFLEYLRWLLLVIVHLNFPRNSENNIDFDKMVQTYNQVVQIWSFKLTFNNTFVAKELCSGFQSSCLKILDDMKLNLFYCHVVLDNQCF